VLTPSKSLFAFVFAASAACAAAAANDDALSLKVDYGLSDKPDPDKLLFNKRQDPRDLPDPAARVDYRRSAKTYLDSPEASEWDVGVNLHMNRVAPVELAPPTTPIPPRTAPGVTINRRF
jgi:hypothetical protein